MPNDQKNEQPNEKKNEQPIESISSQDIKVSPYNMKVEKLDISEKINEHTSVILYGRIQDHNVERYERALKYNEKIKIRIGTKETFYGIVTKVTIINKSNTYYMSIEALSYTYLLDIEKKQRTFQDSDKEYIELVKEITKKYGGQVDTTQGCSKKLGKFTMQYLETDWQFIKRMASRCNEVLIPKKNVDNVAFYFGVPYNVKSIKMKRNNYSAKKNLKDYEKNFEPYKEENIKLSESHYIFYEINTRQNAEVGAKVDLYLGNKTLKNLIIKEIEISLSNGLLKFKYILCPSNGLAQIPTFNDEIIGASFNGKVIGIKEDKVQIKFNFEKGEDKHKNKNLSKKHHWFPYSTIYSLKDNVGWYCMPEMGDDVRVYFPNREEEHGIVINSTKMDTLEKPIDINMIDGNRVTHPDVKSFQTAYGKRIIFAPEQILIVGDGTVIQLHDTKGISVLAHKKIEFNAQEKLIFTAKKIIGDADEIDLYCKDNKIEVGKDEILLQGEKIHLN